MVTYITPFTTIGVVSSDLIIQALTLILFGSIGIVLWITYRFRDFKMGVCALISLAHDVIVVVGIFAILGTVIGIQIDSLFVTAMLTIIGFSVNDTVVIYDRVRENSRRLRGASFPELVDLSVSEMLGRTVITSGTAILSLLPFLVWGTNALQDFSFTLIVGMVSGVYSTVFVALPLTHWLDRLLLSKRRTAAARRSPQPRAKRELNPL